MSNLQSIFGAGLDVSTVEPQGDFDVLLPGDYVVGIEKSEVKSTKKQDGHYLELTMTVLDGQFKSRKLWDRIQIENPSQKCVEIGRKQLSALGRATGVLIINNEDQFLGKTCIACVKVKDNQNEVRTYKALTQEADTRPPQSYPVQQPAYTPPQQTAGADAIPGLQPTAVGAPSIPPWARQ